MTEELKSLTPEEFNNLESDGETPPEESTPEKTEEALPPEKEEEQRVPYSRFEEVNSRLKNAEETIQRLETKREDKPLSPEEQQTLEAKKYLRGILEEVIAEKEATKEAEEEKAVEEFKKESERLSSLYKDFDTDKVVKFANSKEIDDLERAYWRMKAEGKTDEVPKPKLPKASATSDTIQKEVLNTSGMDLYQAAQAAKQRLGIK